MAKGVPSDGRNHTDFATFLSRFDNMSDAQIKKAMEHFSKKKENGRERLDDVKLPALALAIYKFDARFKKVPPIIKHYCFIKLQQGQKSWSAQIDQTIDQTDKLPWEIEA